MAYVICTDLYAQEINLNMNTEIFMYGEANKEKDTDLCDPDYWSQFENYERRNVK